MNTERSAANYDFVTDLLRGADRPVSEQRRFPRRPIQVAVQLIPVTARGLQYDRAMPAITRNIAEGGIALFVSAPPVAKQWAVRLEIGKRAALIEVNLRQVQKTADGYLLSCQFVRRLDPPVA
jgi:hypothetical protein